MRAHSDTVSLDGLDELGVPSHCAELLLMTWPVSMSDAVMQSAVQCSMQSAVQYAVSDAVMKSVAGRA